MNADQALLDFLIENLPGEESRHDAETEGLPDVWMAQVDSLASRLAARFAEVALEEMKTSLGPAACLHRQVAALKVASEHVAYIAHALAGALFQAHGLGPDGGEDGA